MGWDGSGNFTRTNGINTGTEVWQDDEAEGTNILSDLHDNHDQDLADGINNCLTKDGQNSPTADIDFAGFWIKNSALEVSDDDAKGAALIGYDGDTVADALDDVQMVSGVRQGITAGTNIDAEFATWCVDYADTGIVLKLPPGNYQITTHYEIQGWALDLSAGAQIEVSGSDEGVFAEGALELLTGGRLIGGVIYTTGTMNGDYVSSHALEPCVVHVNGGEIVETTVYSQINCCIKRSAGKLTRAKTYGGWWDAVRYRITVDEEQTIDVETNRVGCRWVNKAQVDTVNLSNVFAMIITASLACEKRILIRHKNYWSAKQGIWIQPDNSAYTLQQVIIQDPIEYRCGYWLDGSGTPQAGDASGTGIEFFFCPDLVIESPIIRRCAGYGIAVVTGSDRTKIRNYTQHAAVNDPSIFIGADDVEVNGFTINDATVGFDIGLDGYTAARTIIRNGIIRAAAYGPFRASRADGILIDNVHVYGGGDNSTVSGSFSGVGELYDVLRVYEGNVDPADVQNVTVTNCSFYGKFTEIVRRNEVGESIKVRLGNNTYNCPYIPPPDYTFGFRQIGMFDHNDGIVPILAADTGGRAGTGIITIDSSSTSNAAALAVTDIEPFVGTQAAASDKAGQWYLLFYIQCTADMNGNVLFGLNHTGTVTHTAGAAILSPGAILANADLLIGGFQIGEWIPCAIPLRSAIYASSTDYSALTNFVVLKTGYSPNYELIYTKPVICMGEG